MVRRAFPDLRFTADVVVSDGQFVAGRWTMTGTSTGPFDLFGLPPTGRPVTMTGQEIFRAPGCQIAAPARLSGCTGKPAGSAERRTRGTSSTGALGTDAAGGHPSLPGYWPGLANIWLPAEQHHTTGPRGCLRDQRIKNCEFGMPSYQHARHRRPHADTVNTAAQPGAMRAAFGGSRAWSGTRPGRAVPFTATDREHSGSTHRPPREYLALMPAGRRRLAGRTPHNEKELSVL
jgi:SnoaL-like polyketide cyclase